MRELKRLYDRQRNYLDEYLSWLKHIQSKTDEIVLTDIDIDLERKEPEEYKVKTYL